MTQLFPLTGEQHLPFWIRSLPAPCFVYVIQAGKWGAIKIGKARDVYKRIATLQTGNSETLRLLYVLPGDERLERELHSRLGFAKLHGEWFDAEKAEPILEMICRLADGMKLAFEEGRWDDFDDLEWFDPDGNRLPQDERNSSYQRKVDDCWEKVAVKRASRERLLKQRDERQKREFAQAHSIPVFTPHRPS